MGPDVEGMSPSIAAGPARLSSSLLHKRECVERVSEKEKCDSNDPVLLHNLERYSNILDLTLMCHRALSLVRG